MKELALVLLLEYQREITAAYRCLQQQDSEGYAGGLYRASRVAERARGQLSKKPLALFEDAATRSADVLRKCVSLGLSNIEKRLAEFRLVEIVGQMLSEKSPARRKELAADNSWLRAA